MKSNKLTKSAFVLILIIFSIILASCHSSGSAVSSAPPKEETTTRRPEIIAISPLWDIYDSIEEFLESISPQNPQSHYEVFRNGHGAREEKMMDYLITLDALPVPRIQNEPLPIDVLIYRTGYTHNLPFIIYVMDPSPFPLQAVNISNLAALEEPDVLNCTNILDTVKTLHNKSNRYEFPAESYTSISLVLSDRTIDALTRPFNQNGASYYFMYGDWFVHIEARGPLSAEFWNNFSLN